MSPEEAAVLAAQAAQYDGIELVVPLLKIGQALTREVQDGEADAGEYIESLTGAVLGTEVEFVVASFHQGRFYAPKDSGRTYVASGDIVPDSWSPDPHVGRPFSEHPDAEEQFKAAVNAGDREWGKGPPIQTTLNFTGAIVDNEVPVRLSLKSTHVKVGRKWVTLIRTLRAPWDNVFELGTARVTNKAGQASFSPTVKKGRATTPDERSAALVLALRAQKDEIKEAGQDQDDASPAAAKQAADRANEAGDGLNV